VSEVLSKEQSNSLIIQKFAEEMDVIQGIEQLLCQLGWKVDEEFV
jgi:hypothetical protein